MVQNVIQKERKSTFWLETIAGETAFESDTDCRVKNRRANKMIFEKKSLISSTAVCRAVYRRSVFQNKIVSVTLEKILNTTMLQSEQKNIGILIPKR